MSTQVKLENQTEQKKENCKIKKMNRFSKWGFNAITPFYFLREREDIKKYGKMFTFLKSGL